MQRSKSVALAFLLGALLVGGVLGFSAYPVFIRPAPAAPPERERLVDVLGRELQLSPAQRAGVDSILDRRHQEFRAILAPVRPQMDSARLRARADIARLLDDAQRQRFELMVAEMDARKRAKAAAEGGR